MQPGPDGMPALTNAIGQLDVDIIVDEGPDTVTMMQDTYEALSQVLPSVAPMLSPPLAAAALQVLVEASPLPEDAKKQLRAAQQAQEGQPSPEAQKAQMEQQNAQMKMQIDAQSKAQDLQIKQQEAAFGMQVEREKMNLEREKVGSQIQLE